MTHKIIPIFSAFLLAFLSGCVAQTEQSVPENAAFCDDITKHVQQVEQLHVASGTTDCTPDDTETAAYHYDTVYGMWFPYLDYGEILAGKTADQFRDAVRQRFQQVADMGINTVYLHLRAFGDAYYQSALFPPAKEVGDYDPFSILLEEAHQLHLSVHGWVNPLRLQKDSAMAAMPDSYPVKQWYSDPQKNGTYLCKVGEYWWLNPAYPEVRRLVADGVAEVMLLGQNVNSYGKDLEQPLTFAQLLQKINDIPGEFVIRFMSSHPKDATPELLDTILQCSKVGHHLHLPVQSGSNDVLRRMNRKYTVEKYMESVNYLRRRDPDFSLTTDLIVGFPDETEEDFQGTLDLVQRVQYDNIYTFIYSKRRGTKAAEMEDHTTDAEKSDRMERLLSLQREIASEHNKRFIGRTLRVLVDGESKRPGRLVGKDNAFIIVEFPGDPSLIGTFQNVRITEARNWAVLGELAEEEQK